MTDWISYDEQKPTEAGFYEWKQEHKKGFTQIFYAEMRWRGNGMRDGILSPSFDHWDGYRVHVPEGLFWRKPEDAEAARKSAKQNHVKLPDLNLRPCPFCETEPTIRGSQCGYPGGGDGVVICAKPENYNTWRIDQCCRLIGFNGFASPESLAAAWNGDSQ